ncbi:MAG: NAD-dependent epimerase/dehydratase family protein [Planctomycetota bacterium]|jgi:2'-hydroxyisoflavone reductase
MSTTRRQFIGLSIAAAGAYTVRSFGGDEDGPAGARRGVRPLRILVLGGTGFIGPYVVRRALDRGHTVTLFNRGRTNTHLFPEVEKLVGDRDGRIEALRDREWDAVIDNTGYVPRHVRDSARLLEGAIGRYLFTSTRQVYADFTAPDKDENAPLAVLEDPESENVREHYGPLKVLCEKEVRAAFGSRATIVRSTAVAGPGDRSDRFTYWPVRIDRGGEVLAPGRRTDPLQFIDVRDLTQWMIRLIEEDVTGVFNAAGPEADLSIAEFLYGIRAVTSANVRFTWVPADFLAGHNVRPRGDMPLWTPPKVPGTRLSPINRDKAVALGLTFRPLAETALDTLEWHKARPVDERSLRRGISARREAEVLAAWRARSCLSAP